MTDKSNHPKKITNAEIASVLERIAGLIEAQDVNVHRVNAYHNAAANVLIGLAIILSVLTACVSGFQNVQKTNTPSAGASGNEMIGYDDLVNSPLKGSTLRRYTRLRRRRS